MIDEDADDDDVVRGMKPVYEGAPSNDQGDGDRSSSSSTESSHRSTAHCAGEG